MVRAVSKYSLLSILASTIPVRLAQRRRTTINHRETDRTIAQSFISALHLFETMILRFTIDHLRASRVVGTWLPPGGYLATSVDQLVTLLFAKYAREVAKALPSDQAYPLRGSEKRTARASNGLALGLISGFGTNRTNRAGLMMSVDWSRPEVAGEGSKRRI